MQHGKEAPSLGQDGRNIANMARFGRKLVGLDCKRGRGGKAAAFYDTGGVAPFVRYFSLFAKQIEHGERKAFLYSLVVLFGARVDASCSAKVVEYNQPWLPVIQFSKSFLIAAQE